MQRHWLRRGLRGMRWSVVLLILLGAGCGDDDKEVELLLLEIEPSQLSAQGGPVEVRARIRVEDEEAEDALARLLRGQQLISSTDLNLQGDVWVGTLQVPANATAQTVTYTVEIVAEGKVAGSGVLQVLGAPAALVVRSVLVDPNTLHFTGGQVIVRARIDVPVEGLDRAEVRVTGPGLANPIVRRLVQVGEGIYERTDVPIPAHPQSSSNQAVIYQLEVHALANDGASDSAATSVTVNAPDPGDRPPPPPS